MEYHIKKNVANHFYSINQTYLAERFFQIKYQDKTIILYLIKAILPQNIKSDSYVIYMIILDILTANDIEILVKFLNENLEEKIFELLARSRFINHE